MAKKKEKGEQGKLFEIHGKKAKEIIEAAQLYKKYQDARISAGVKEAEQKKLILDLVKKSNLQVLAGGKIKCVVDGLSITITPRDELVQVKERTEPEP